MRRKKQISSGPNHARAIPVLIFTFLFVLPSMALAENDGYELDLSVGGHGTVRTLHLPAYCLNRHREMPVAGSGLEVAPQLMGGDVLKVVNLTRKVADDREAVAGILMKDEEWGELIRTAKVYKQWLSSDSVKELLKRDPAMKKKIDSTLALYEELTSKKTFESRSQYAVWAITDGLTLDSTLEWSRESNEEKPKDKRESEEVLRHRALNMFRYVQCILDAAGLEIDFDTDHGEQGELSKNLLLKKFKAAKLDFNKGNYTQALLGFTECLTLGSSSSTERSEIRVWLAKTHLNLNNDHQSAADQLRRALDDDPTNSTAAYELGMLQVKQGQYDEANKSFTQTVHISPSAYPLAHFFMGTYYYELGDYENAMKSYGNFVRNADPIKDKDRVAQAQKWVVVLGMLNQADKGGGQ